MFQNLIHIDAYRIEHESELEVLQFRDLLNNPDNLIVIEWPERIPSLVPENAHRLAFAHAGEGSRVITIA
jgi:tRNA A37 threonylcarbamoyladenosine biosynthesis protein TsaE